MWNRDVIGGSGATDVTVEPAVGKVYRIATWLCVALVILSIGCRVRLSWVSQSFWYDESYLLLNIQSKNYSELIGRLDHQQAAPPIFLWTLRVLYLRFGLSEWALRLPAAIAALSP